jgi:23S rRNA A1618 N6-methylase RlmF
MMPFEDQAAVFHFHSSMIDGSAPAITARNRASNTPRQCCSFPIRASISSVGDLLASVSGVFFGKRLAAADIGLASCTDGSYA